MSRRTGPKGEPLLVVDGPIGAGDLPSQVVATSMSNVTAPLATVIQAFAPARYLPGQVVVRDQRVSVPGSREAQLTERTWQAPVTSGAAQVARVLELRLITPDHVAVSFLVRSADADFTSSALRAVFSSFRLS